MFRVVSPHVVASLNTWCSRLPRRFLSSSPTIRSSSTSAVDHPPTAGGDVGTAKPGKPLSNRPIVKEFFLGRVPEEVFEFPELDSMEEVAELDQLYEPIEKFMKEGLDSNKIDRDSKIPPETLQLVKDLGLFGQMIPTEYGGLGLTATKFARLAEATALDGAISVTLAAHQSIGIKGILIAGTESQKSKYLPKLATGEHVAAFCLTEPGSGSDSQSIITKATPSTDGKHFLISGTKIYITNGGFADIMTVFAKTPNTDPSGKTGDKVTAFIVERSFGGVTSGPPEDKLGIRGSNTCEVHFENCPVPVENVIGEVGHGFKIAMQILNSGRFSMGSSGAGIMRHLLSHMVNQALTRQQFDKPIGQFALIQEKLAEMAVDAYVMESMSYLTAGLLDQYEKPDLAIEAAIVKVYSSEAIWRGVNETLQIMAGQGYMRTSPYERYVRDARILPIFEGTNEILRIFIGGTALQYAGRALTEDIRKLRRPLANFGFIVSEVRKAAKLKNSMSDTNLAANLHHNLTHLFSQYQKYLVEFGLAVKGVLAKYGKDTMEYQMTVKRLSNIAIDLYAITACFGHYSRSISIGVPHNDHEMDLVSAFCSTAFPRIERNLKEVIESDKITPDIYYKRIAEMMFREGGYAAKHALTRTW